MRTNITLPELERKLDGLREGGLYHLSRGDYELMFGMNDAALGRLRNFSKSHECVTSFTDNHVLFRKKLQVTSETERLTPSGGDETERGPRSISRGSLPD